MPDETTLSLLSVSIGQILISVGWEKTTNSGIQILLDLTDRFLKRFSKFCRHSLEQEKRNELNLFDLLNALNMVGFTHEDISKHMRDFGNVAFIYPSVPDYPLLQTDFECVLTHTNAAVSGWINHNLLDSNIETAGFENGNSNITEAHDIDLIDSHKTEFAKSVDTIEGCHNPKNEDCHSLRNEKVKSGDHEKVLDEDSGKIEKSSDEIKQGVSADCKSEKNDKVLCYDDDSKLKMTKSEDLSSKIESAATAACVVCKDINEKCSSELICCCSVCGKVYHLSCVSLNEKIECWKCPLCSLEYDKNGPKDGQSPISRKRQS